MTGVSIWDIRIHVQGTREWHIKMSWACFFKTQLSPFRAASSRRKNGSSRAVETRNFAKVEKISPDMQGLMGGRQAEIKVQISDSCKKKAKATKNDSLQKRRRNFES